MNATEAWDEEFWADIRRKNAELEARYEAINQAWLDCGIPTFVLKTQDWQSGWSVLLDWVCRISGNSNRNWDPLSQTAWETEIHIFSHFYSPISGHCPEQATIEEEGTRAILAWWHNRGRP